MSAMIPARFAVLVLGGLAALRFVHWGAPLTDDEAFMLRSYANQPLLGIATSFEAPNNHILLAMLLHVVNALSPKELFVSMAHPGALQAVSILASIGAVLLLYRLVSAAFSARTGLLAAAALGLSYWHLLYSHEMRGYSLSSCLLVAAVWAVHQGAVRARRRPLIAFPFLLAAFNYTVASNLYISLGLSLGLGGWLLQAREKPALRNEVLAALAGGLLLSALLYAPIYGAMREAARQGPLDGGFLAAMAARLGFAVEVLGSSAAFRGFFASCAVLGSILALRRPRRETLLPILAVAMILTPLLATTAQGIVIPFARTYIPLLPFWALLFALGLEGIADFAALRMPAAVPALPCVLAGLVAFPSLREVRRFVSWNAGMDVRGLMGDVAVRSRNMDDFVLIHPAAEPDPAGGPLAWEYHAFAAGLKPQLRAVAGQDADYMLRKQYFVAAESESAARASLERSRMDPLLAGRIKPLARHGRLELFGVAMDDALLREYQAVAKDEGADPALRAQALTGLAYIYLDSGRLEPAAARLEEARRLAPEDRRARYYLALTRYLAMDDAKAAAEFAAVAASDPANARAPLYYADALAGLGRGDEALRWYAWYDSAANKAHAAAWLFGNRAEMGARSVRRKDRPPPPAVDAAGWAQAARSCEARGSLERAAVAWRAAMRLRPTVDAWLGLAKAHIGLQENAAAEQILKRVLATGAVQENRVVLAKLLFEKRALAEARAELDAFLRAFPAHAEGKELSRALRRSP